MLVATAARNSNGAVRSTQARSEDSCLTAAGGTWFMDAPTLLRGIGGVGGGAPPIDLVCPAGEPDASSPTANVWPMGSLPWPLVPASAAEASAPASSAR